MTSWMSRKLAIVVAVVGMLFVTVGSAAASPVTYHGGPVVRNPQVRVIFWGSNWSQNPGAREQIQGLFGSLSGSNYQKVLTQYYDTGGAISPNVSFDSWTDQSIAAPSNVNWSNIENEIQYAIGQRGWPGGGINNLYMVLPAPGSKYQSGFVLGCGSHYFASSLGSPMAYVGWPGDEPFKGCPSIYDPGQLRDWVSASVVASHEYAEAVTDPVTKKYLGTFNGVGWITEAEEREVADKCIYLGGGMANGFHVNYLWDNSQNQCALAPAPPPPQPPSPPVPGNYRLAFTANTGSLITIGPGYGVNWGQGMAPGTSPGIARLANGSRIMAFQTNEGRLATIGESGGATYWGVGMAPGTSPSIAGLSGGGFEVAFQTSEGKLASINSGTGSATYWQQGMKPGTSPSIAGLASNKFVIAFQANTGSLISIGPGISTNWGQGMASGTSPAVTALINGSYAMVFQTNKNELASIGPTIGGNYWKQSMMAGTSPSITTLSSGDYMMAFEANTGVLVSMNSTGNGTNWGQGMAGSSSPSISGLASGTYVIAFKTNKNELASIGPGGATYWAQEMAPGTSPSASGG